jgi:DNA-binding transcriptional regulator LsrR (DeoR family)
MLGQKMSANAHVIQAPISVRNKSIRDTLFKENKILIAMGKEKLKGILGALRGDLVDVLIVDMDTVQHLLDT